MTRRDLAAMAIILISFAAAVVITDPRGNFPLDDDWDFTLSTWNLVHTGTVQHTPFTSNIAVLQYFWGALWTILFGESSAVLRASTLALSLLATLLIFTTLRRLEIGTSLALVAALAFFFHPLIFWASFTYMTDVPELFLSVAAFALLVEALRRENDAWLAAAVITAVASFFVRQIGIVNALTPLIAAVTFRHSIGVRWKKIAGWYGSACALFLILLLSGALIVSQQELQIHMLQWSDLLAAAAHYAFLNFQNAALFFLPLTLLALAIRPRPLPLIMMAIWFAAASGHLISLQRPIPYPVRGNLFINFGLGPPTLRDTFVFRMPYPFHLPYTSLLAIMLATTLLAIFVAAMTLVAVRSLPIVARIAALYCICATVIIMFMRIYFDRYSIDTMWPLAIVIPVALQSDPRPAVAFRNVIAAIALAIVIIFSVAGTAEYLAWNRARWAAFRWLQARGVTLDQMDAGYEINALLAIRTGRKFLGKEGFAVRDDQFILSFNEVPGYTTLAAFPYPRMLGSNGVVRAMRRTR